MPKLVLREKNRITIVADTDDIADLDSLIGDIRWACKPEQYIFVEFARDNEVVCEYFFARCNNYCTPIWSPAETHFCINLGAKIGM
jgi:hypothetical protein